MPKQVVVIHGGDSFATYEEYLDSLKNWEVSIESFLPRTNDWKRNLQSDLGSEYQVLLPQMPNKTNAVYLEWKIWFERMFPYLNDEVILVGHSLGGIFLARYLSENKFPKKITKLMLVAAPDDKSEASADMLIIGDLSSIGEQCTEIHLFQSTDDQVVTPSAIETYATALPAAKKHIFEDRGHFNQEHFPEIVEIIKK